MFRNRFESKTVLLTGHTGFKGSWLSMWLSKLGANVVGVSDGMVSQPNHFESLDTPPVSKSIIADITEPGLMERIVDETQPDFVFHLAAQALVKKSYQDPLATIETNVMGTARVLMALRQLEKPCVAVMITSDKAYENVETFYGYREEDRIGGVDPYSSSKGAAEIVISSLIRSYFNEPANVRVAIARAGNVIGGGDWAADRIVPDIARSWSNKEVLEIRQPAATRPWQHVLEPLSGYLHLAAELVDRPELHGEPFNFGPNVDAAHPVSALVKVAQAMLPGLNVELGDPGDFHEAGLLALCCDKARTKLGWKAVLDFDETMDLTLSWYQQFYSEPVKLLTSNNIDTYIELADARQLSWVK